MAAKAAKVTHKDPMTSQGDVDDVSSLDVSEDEPLEGACLIK